MPKKASTQKGPRILDQKFEEVPVDQIRTHPRNPNEGDVAEIGASIEDSGFYGACVVQRSTGYILAGNHRYLAARSKGLAVVPVLWLDVDDERSLRILLGDNRISELAHRNDKKLAALLAELSDGTGLHGTGYDDGDLSSLLGKLSEEQDEEGVQRISEESGTATATPSLKWQGHTVPMTDAELDSLNEAFERWMQEARFAYGFVGSLFVRS